MDDARLARAMNLSVTEGALATAMATLAGGVFLTGFALELGASRLQLGILAALPVLGNLTQLAGAYLLNRTGGSKPLCVWMNLASRLLWLPIPLLPFLFPTEGQGLWGLIALYGSSCALASLGGVGWLMWIRELIPADHRVAFLGRRNLYNTGLSLLLGLGSAFFLDWCRASTETALTGFLAVFALASLCGLGGLPLMAAIPAPVRLESATTFSWPRLFDPWREVSFRRLLAFYALWNVSVHLAQPFFAVYMLQKLGLSFGMVTVLTTLSSLLGLLGNNFWTRLKARFGTKPVVQIATLFDVAVPILWLFAAPGWWPLLVLIHAFGFLNAPLTLGPNLFLMRLAPQQNAAPYLTTFNASIGTLSAVAAISGGLISSLLVDWSWTVGPIEFGGLKAIFLLSAIGRLASLPILFGITEPEAQEMRHVLAFIRRPNRPVAPQAELPPKAA